MLALGRKCLGLFVMHIPVGRFLGYWFSYSTPVWRKVSEGLDVLCLNKRMSKLPGSTGISLLGDKSLEFYRDPITFCERRIEKHGSRIFQARLLNKSTSFVCSVQGMKELLCGRLRSFRGHKGCVCVWRHHDVAILDSHVDSTHTSFVLLNTVNNSNGVAYVRTFYCGLYSSAW